jgi:hypothetical protein
VSPLTTTVGAPPDATAAAETVEYGPWNPGLESQVPRRLRHLITLFRPENAFADYATAQELADYSGLPVTELATLRPPRLALHELLVRVTADLSVPDGSRIEDLGINFREMVRALLRGYVEPRMSVIEATYDEAKRRLAAQIDAELAALRAGAGAPVDRAARPTGLRWRDLFVRRRGESVAAPTGANGEQRAVGAWERRARASADEVERAACAALARVVSALLVRHGQVWGNRELMASLALNLACNDYAARQIGRAIDPWLTQATPELGYRVLPRQQEPVVMNTKGPSASGKSTLRPLQKALAREIGVDWADFALFSADIWRKQLLDYGTLGAEYKYGGAFTGDEVQIIDHKLDRYMARKADHGGMSHLLIDRFRFDSFAPDSTEAGSNLLTRFGQIVYLFFMITPPASLVERAWHRGLEVGRYKAVDDTLAHGVEAYSGMPELFFTWAGRPDKRVHFEFLDNSVRLGERPRTVAFGQNDELYVLDVKCLIDVERYRRVNVDATGPQSLFPDAALLEPQRNAAFLVQCVRRFRVVHFAEQSTGRIYVTLAAGAPSWKDGEALDAAVADPDTRAGLLAAAPAILDCELPSAGAPRHLRALPQIERTKTLGAWGSRDA